MAFYAGIYPPQINRIALSGYDNQFVEFTAFGSSYVNRPELARHVGSNNINFLDGHAESVSQQQTFSLTYLGNMLGKNYE